MANFTTMNLGDYSKWLEKNFSLDVAIPMLPVILRLDGNNFSKWTKGLKKPFDSRLSDIMIATTKFLVEETNAIIGYTQSDEITLILYSPSKQSSIYHNGEKQKILSKLTAKLVNFFNKMANATIPEKGEAIFDCRFYQTPTLHDACAQLIWRENDAEVNSVSMVAQSEFPHKSLQGLDKEAQIKKLQDEKNISWYDFEDKYRRGTFVKRTQTNKPFTKEEIETLPAKHKARQNPELIVERNIISEFNPPTLRTIQNLVDVIFDNQTPILKQ
jgi:tRNA(His) guanylyltransferase